MRKAVAQIGFYLIQSLHLFLGFRGACRFEPTCSSFARQAWETHGFFVGSLIILRRLVRCHPWSGRWGYDPIPELRSE